MFNFMSLLMALAASAPEAADKAIKGLSFTTENLSEALLCSLAGMVGIFIVVGIIILSVNILNKASSRPAKKKEDK